MRLSIFAKIIDLFFPRFCPMCGNRLVGEEEVVCLSCLLYLPRMNTWENPYENEMAKMFWHRMPIERCGALFYYQGHSFASRLVYQLKYQNHPEVGEFLGRIMSREAQEHDFFEGIDAIIPIPLTPRRKRQRGYNQSEEIAKGIQKNTGLPILNDVVVRCHFKESQTKHKDRLARADNVKNVFSLAPKYKLNEKLASELRGKHFLIVDDVCTTGATILSCCQALMKAGKMKFSVMSIGYAKG